VSAALLLVAAVVLLGMFAAALRLGARWDAEERQEPRGPRTVDTQPWPAPR
jgi:hypothetical protein